MTCSPDFAAWFAGRHDSDHRSAIGCSNCLAIRTADRGLLQVELSIEVLQKVLEVLHAHLVIQTDGKTRAQTSVAGAAEALALASR